MLKVNYIFFFKEKDLPKCYVVDIAKENKNSNTLFEIQVQKVAR